MILIFVVVVVVVVIIFVVITVVISVFRIDAVVATIVVWTTIPSYKKRKKPEPIPVAKEVLPIKIDSPKKTTPKAPTFPKLQWV